MNFKRGDKIIQLSSGIISTVLGPEDFDGYDYNKPGDKWELTFDEVSGRTWTPAHNSEAYALYTDDDD